MQVRDPEDKRTAIERALESIPPEVRFRVRGEGVADRDSKPEKPGPEPVAPKAAQGSLFEMENRDE